MDLFEYATKNQLRFSSTSGRLTVEDVWVLPLTSSKGLSLDLLAQGIAKRVQEAGEQSFVVKRPAGDRVLRIQLDIVKHVIAVRMAEVADRQDAATKAGKRADIMAALVAERASHLGSMSKADLLAELDKLDGTPEEAKS